MPKFCHNSNFVDNKLETCRENQIMRTVTWKVHFPSLACAVRAWNNNSLTSPLIPNCGAKEALRRPNSRREADMFSTSLYNSRFDFELWIARLLGGHFAFVVTYYLSNDQDVVASPPFVTSSWNEIHFAHFSSQAWAKNTALAETNCVSAGMQRDNNARFRPSASL